VSKLQSFKLANDVFTNFLVSKVSCRTNYVFANCFKF
jgi:hypothetical protein